MNAEVNESEMLGQLIGEVPSAFVFRQKPVYSLIKRIIDFFAALLCIVLFVLPFAVILLAILIDDPKAPPIFVQQRVGKNGKRFRMYKFRTMCAHAEEQIGSLREMNEMDGPVFKIRDDPRITRFGKYLRSTNIDELPQVFNIFLGQMSFVGPRPALPDEVEQYRESDKLRLLVTPGLTCYWQATHNRTNISFDEWMKMDRKYIMERSIRVDFRLILKTIAFLFRKTDDRQ